MFEDEDGSWYRFKFFYPNKDAECFEVNLPSGEDQLKEAAVIAAKHFGEEIWIVLDTIFNGRAHFSAYRAKDVTIITRRVKYANDLLGKIQAKYGTWADYIRERA